MVLFADVGCNLPARRPITRHIGETILGQDGQPIISGGSTDGDLGWIGIAIAAGTFLLGGGGLWHLHERHTEKSDRLKCIEQYSDPGGPWKLSPEKAADICSHGYEPKKGFEFGFNVPSLVIVGGSLFGLWFLASLLIHKK